MFTRFNKYLLEPISNQTLDDFEYNQVRIFSGLTIINLAFGIFGSLLFIDLTDSLSRINLILTATASLLLLFSYYLGRMNRIKEATMISIAVISTSLTVSIVITEDQTEEYLVYFILNIIYSLFFLNVQEAVIVSFSTIIYIIIFPIFYTNYNFYLVLTGPVLYLTFTSLGLFYIILIKLDHDQKKSKRILELEKIAVNIDRDNLLGLVAKGISHDINNQLNIVQFNLDLLDNSNTPQENLSQYYEGMKIAIKNAGNLSKRLAQLGVENSQDKTIFSLNSLLQEISILIRKTSHQVKFHWTIPHDDCLVFANKNSISNAILNVIFNANQAIKGSGSIEIELKSQEITNSINKETFLIVPNNGYHHSIIVTDNGVGMAPSDISKSIIPFYSTKRETGGTGLGLANVSRMLSELNGGMSIVSKINEGTIVTMYFPAHKMDTNKV